MYMGNNKVKSFVASGAIQPRRLVKFGATDTTVVQAASAADGGSVIGVSDSIGAADTARCECYVLDFADVEFGGTVARGGPVTSDASGRAVAATTGQSYCGIAMVAAVTGDIASIRIARGVAP